MSVSSANLVDERGDDSRTSLKQPSLSTVYLLHVLVELAPLELLVPGFLAVVDLDGEGKHDLASPNKSRHLHGNKVAGRAASKSQVCSDARVQTDIQWNREMALDFGASTWQCLI